MEYSARKQLCVCVYVCVYIYIYIYKIYGTYIQWNTQLENNSVYVYVCIYIYIYIYIHTHICRYINI